MPECQKRRVTLTIRVTPGENDAILRKANQADMNLTNYLVASTLCALVLSPRI